MKIAIPLDASHAFSSHYGASSAFAICLVDPVTGRTGEVGLLVPIAGTPCSWPAWLRAEGVDVLLVGGMGAGARAACAERGIEVVPGVAAAAAEKIAADYATGHIRTGANACAEGRGDGRHHHHDDDHKHGHGCCQHGA